MRISNASRQAALHGHGQHPRIVAEALLHVRDVDGQAVDARLQVCGLEHFLARKMGRAPDFNALDGENSLVVAMRCN